MQETAAFPSLFGVPRKSRHKSGGELAAIGGSGYNDSLIFLNKFGLSQTIQMVYRILADAVVLLHFLFILFVVAGGLLALCRTP